jgi:hypothetical protein
LTKERVGFVGLGLMGRGMARNILKKGWPLAVLAHRSRTAVEALVAEGATEVSSARALAESCDVIVLCVTGSPEVAAVVDGPEGLASAGKPLVIIDCSTSDPAQTMALASRLTERGITLIDAPLSRTPKDAEAGTLDVMVGGAPEIVARVRPIIDCFAGRSPQVFDQVIRGGRMDCGFYQTFFKYVLERDRNAHQFAIRNALKDMTYLAGFAAASEFANPLGAAVRNSFAGAVGAGKAEDYVPMLSDFIAEANGVSLVPKD